VANTEGHVTLVELSFENHGTKALSIDKISVNGTTVNSSDVAYYEGTPIAYPNLGVNMLVFPEDFVFQQGASYSFLIQTASGRHFTFVLPVDEIHTMQENLTIVQWTFFHWPPGSQLGYIGVTVQNSPRFNLIARAWVNNSEASLASKWMWAGHDDGFTINYDFGNFTYDVRFQTACGNIYEFPGHGYQSYGY
jgi:hypothetical protein